MFYCDLFSFFIIYFVYFKISFVIYAHFSCIKTVIIVYGNHSLDMAVYQYDFFFAKQVEFTKEKESRI